MSKNEHFDPALHPVPPDEGSAAGSEDEDTVKPAGRDGDTAKPAGRDGDVDTAKPAGREVNLDELAGL